MKTLDALHLASALLLREPHRIALIFATHHQQQAAAAHALGFECIGVGQGRGPTPLRKMD